MDLFDVHVLQRILGIALAGGLIALDRTALGQFMVSQPIVAAPLAGWALGDVNAGFTIGAVLELIWVLDMPVGTFVPADSTIAAIAATAVAVLGSRGGPADPGLIGFSVLMTAALAPVTMCADGYVRHRNARLAAWAMAEGAVNVPTRLAVAQAAGLTWFFLKGFVLLALIVPAGLAAAAGYAAMPEPVHTAMSFYLRLLLLLGAAAVVSRLSRFVVDRYLLFGAVSAAIAAMVFHAPPVVAVIVAAGAGWLGVRYRER